MRRVARRIVLLWMLLSWGSTLWVLSQNPFAAPLVARSASELGLALRRAMALAVTANWLIPRLEDAIAQGRSDDVAIYLALAEDHGIALPADLAARAEAFLDTDPGVLAAVGDCALCAYDITHCPTLAMLGACAIPVEMTPLGDLNALRRAGAALAAGEAVDHVDAGLALVGLAGTGLVILSGGSSATAKLGASVLRLARRTGALAPRLGAAIGDAVSGLVHWDRLPRVLSRDLPLEGALDARRWEVVMMMAEDAGTIRRNTSIAEALMLLRGIDSPDDLARLARVSEVAGSETRRIMHVLGPGALRLVTRVSGLALAALGLVMLVLGQIATLVPGVALSGLRALLRRPARRARAGPVA